ncbi:MAG: hypothetical protein ACR2M1_11310 [Gemmatimonadaceae bacterium]
MTPDTPDPRAKAGATVDAAGELTFRHVATLSEYEACVALQRETWGRGFTEVVPATILRVSQYVGGITAGAFDAEDRLVGFVFGITGVRDGRLVHWSDLLAVRPEVRDCGVGYRLKLFQREALLAGGISTMFWTYDPLVAKNAYFNLV